MQQQTVYEYMPQQGAGNLNYAYNILLPGPPTERLERTSADVAASRVTFNFSVRVGNDHISCHLAVLKGHTKFFEDCLPGQVLPLPDKYFCGSRFEFIYNWMMCTHWPVDSCQLSPLLQASDYLGTQYLTALLKAEIRAAEVAPKKPNYNSGPHVSDYYVYKPPASFQPTQMQPAHRNVNMIPASFQPTHMQPAHRNVNMTPASFQPTHMQPAQRNVVEPSCQSFGHGQYNNGDSCVYRNLTTYHATSSPQYAPVGTPQIINPVPCPFSMPAVANTYIPINSPAPATFGVPQMTMLLVPAQAGCLDPRGMICHPAPLQMNPCPTAQTGFGTNQQFYGPTSQRLDANATQFQTPSTQLSASAAQFVPAQNYNTLPQLFAGPPTYDQERYLCTFADNVPSTGSTPAHENPPMPVSFSTHWAGNEEESGALGEYTHRQPAIATCAIQDSTVGTCTWADETKSGVVWLEEKPSCSNALLNRCGEFRSGSGDQHEKFICSTAPSVNTFPVYCALNKFGVDEACRTRKRITTLMDARANATAVQTNNHDEAVDENSSCSSFVVSFESDAHVTSYEHPKNFESGGEELDSLKTTEKPGEQSCHMATRAACYAVNDFRDYVASELRRGITAKIEARACDKSVEVQERSLDGYDSGLGTQAKAKELQISSTEQKNRVSRRDQAVSATECQLNKKSLFNNPRSHPPCTSAAQENGGKLRPSSSANMKNRSGCTRSYGVDHGKRTI